MLNRLNAGSINGGINFVDIGASGRLDRYWENLSRFIRLYAFEPNEDECKRLSKQVNKFIAATYMPNAIVGKAGIYTLYKTRDSFCWSLLKPDFERQSRFTYGKRFEVVDREEIECLSLCDVTELHNVDVDVMKIDSQGLELAILQSVPEMVDSAFAIEVETGFAENYFGETRFHQAAAFLEEHGFLLFDLRANHRVSRNNKFKYIARGQEITWGESIWLKDYVKIFLHGGKSISREKALKSLLICANHGCFDYGYELATYYCQRCIISDAELKSLGRVEAWRLPDYSAFKEIIRNLSVNMLCMLPKPFLHAAVDLLSDSARLPNTIKRIVQFKI